MTRDIDETVRIVDSTVGRSEVREHVTIHDSEVGDGCRLYERSSLKSCRVADAVDVNAGAYLENTDLARNVQVGPNATVAGVTHDLGDRGMAFRDDVFERVRLGERSFVGAGAVVGPGVEVGAGSVVAAGATLTRDVGPERIVLGTPPGQRIVPLCEWLE